jgi:hypothetical protein
MKKTLIAIMFLLPAAGFAAAPQPCGKVIYAPKGAVIDAAAAQRGAAVFPKSAVRAEKDSAIVLLTDGTQVALEKGAEILVGSFSSTKKAAGAELEIISGRAWIKSVKSGRDTMLVVKSPFAVFKLKNAVLLVDIKNSQAACLYGMATVSSKNSKVAISGNNRIKFPGAKREVYSAGRDEWVKWNISRDTSSVLIEAGEGLDREMVKEVFESTLRPLYAAGNIEYERGRREYEDFDIVIKPALEISKGAKKEGEKAILKGRLEEGATGEVVDIINEEAEQSEGAVSKEAARAALMRAAAKAGRSVAYYTFTQAADARKVTLDATGSPEELKELSAMLAAINGISGIKEKSFYGQKAVYIFKYDGLASDLAEVLSGRTINKKPLKIYKSTKSILKLSIK